MGSMRLRRLSDSFWFAPAVLGVAAVVLAELLLLADRQLPTDGARVWFVDDLSATGSRALLTTVGGSMLGVAATSFSITISVLATTSSTYGPRLVRNFMADRGNQLVLAVLTSSFVYCLVVLRAVRSELDDASAFVPVLAVNATVLIAVLDVAVLVYFIHHIASSVQVTTLQQRVGRELCAVVEAHYPARAPSGTTSDPARPTAGQELVADRSGYVESVDLRALVRRAGAAGVVVEVVAMPGRHVIPGEPLAVVSGAVAPDGSTQQRLRACFSLGAARTPHQDIAFAIQQLTEMAVRGLATGTNDPYTGVSALDAMGEGLVALVSRPHPPAGLLDAAGELRVLAEQPYAADLVRPVFAALRSFGSDDVLVTCATIALGRRLMGATPDPALRALVHEELSRVATAFEAHGPMAVDVEEVRRSLAAVDLVDLVDLVDR